MQVPRAQNSLAYKLANLRVGISTCFVGSEISDCWLFGFSCCCFISILFLHFFFNKIHQLSKKKKKETKR